MMVVLSAAASFADANLIAPYFIEGLTIMQAMFAKVAISTLTQRFVISLAANGGNFNKAMS